MLRCLEFVATVPHHSCGNVDKLSDRKIVNISSVKRDGLYLASQVLNNVSSKREKNLNGSGILKRVELVNRHSDHGVGLTCQEEAISVPIGDILKYKLIRKFIKM